MSLNDKIKWDKKYLEKESLLKERPASIKLEKIVALVDKDFKTALDVACGAGRNSIYLAKNGFNVDAIDISTIALNSLKEKGYKTINTIETDLDTFTPTKSYDLITMTNFLDRTLLPKLFNALENNGYLFIETYMEHEENEKPPSNSNFLLQKNELKTIFENEDCEIIEYDEFLNEAFEMHKMMKQSIIVKKIG